VIEHNAYFDEAYFERGWERGTAYSDYRRAADNSKTFAEIAEALAFVFQPKRALEIGCATGAIVRRLNGLGVETYGIDVSEWAIQNRLHENVLLGGAESLPFADGEFDLVFSSHSLEHIPRELTEAAFAEMSRVAASDACQFHMLPIVGTYPYDFDHDAARQMLREDPTHNVLEPLEWWLANWGRYGWHSLGMEILFEHDAGMAELSSGQYALSNRPRSDTVIRAREWNRRVHRKMFLDLADQLSRSVRSVPVSPSFEHVSTMISQSESKWRDVECVFDPPVSFSGAIIHIVGEFKAASPSSMRVALVDETDPQERGVLECYIEAQPGLWSLQLDPKDFRILTGKPDISKINSFLIGGELKDASLTIAAAASFKDGPSLQITRITRRPEQMSWTRRWIGSTFRKLRRK
jgi:hypothetical protein